MTSEKPAQKPGGQRSKLFWKLLFIPFFIVGVGTVFIPLWASIDVETIQCEVVSAEPKTSSGGSRLGLDVRGVGQHVELRGYLRDPWSHLRQPGGGCGFLQGR